MELVKSWNLVWNDPHDDGATAALLENIDAKPGNSGDSVGKIGGAFLLELPDSRFILTHDFVSDVVGVLRGQALETFERQLDQLAGYFDLRRPAGRKNQITHLRVGLQHRGDELRCADRSLCGGLLDVAGASVTASSGGISCVGVAMNSLDPCEAHETEGGSHAACSKTIVGELARLGFMRSWLRFPAGNCRKDR